MQEIGIPIPQGLGIGILSILLSQANMILTRLKILGLRPLALYNINPVLQPSCTFSA